MDYNIEYFEFIDFLLPKFVAEIKQKYPEAFIIGDRSCEIPVIKNLLYGRYYINAKESYNQLRKEGKNKEEVQRIFKNQLDQSVQENFTQPSLEPIDDEYLCTLLQPYLHQVFIYIHDERHLAYLTPLIRRIDQPVLLVTEYELPDETDLPDSVTAVTIEFLDEIHYSPFLYHHFPRVYHYFNTFSRLLQILQPCCTITLEGFHYQQEIMAIISRKLSIPSICIQQGWPSLLHSCFRYMQYDYFFTWGDLFTSLFKTRNPTPNFVSAGYMYPVLPKGQKRWITFFLQGPFVIVDRWSMSVLFDFLLQCAALFPEQVFGVREHPGYRFSNDYREQCNKYDNIQFLSDKPLDEVYAETFLVVSHSSSCIMEGIVHGCIPFVFDPTYQSRYSPDIEKMELGIMASNIEDGVEKMKAFLSNSLQKEQFLQKNDEMKSHLFASYGDDTLRKMVQYIKNIITFGRLIKE